MKILFFKKLSIPSYQKKFIVFLCGPTRLIINFFHKLKSSSLKDQSNYLFAVNLIFYVTHTQALAQ